MMTQAFKAGLIAAVMSGFPGMGAMATDPVGTIVVPQNEKTMTLEVRTGPLPKGAYLRLETTDGISLGSVAPFGLTQTSPPDQVHLVVVPLNGIPPGLQEVRARVVLNGKSRPATADEFKAVQILSK